MRGQLARDLAPGLLGALLGRGLVADDRRQRSHDAPDLVAAEPAPDVRQEGHVVDPRHRLAVVAGGYPAATRTAVVWLLVIEVAQGAIGFVQYFTDLPVVLFGFHMLGAALISAAVTWALIQVREPALERAPLGG